MRDGTRVVQAGLPSPEQGEPFLPGPVLAGAFHLRGDPGEAPYTYTRDGNPSWTAYERALGELEGGEAVLFASGMAAASAILLPLCGSGDVLVVADDAYYTVRSLAADELGRRGVDVRLVPTPGEALAEAAAEAKLVWVETPSNPLLEVCDVAAIATAAHAGGALLAVDNTSATPLGQRPLELGADLSISSAAKYMSGHHDLVLGYVAARDPEHAAALRTWRHDTGSIAGPFEAWLAHRSLATLELRLERQCANALALAELLAARDDVEALRYPGLPADPSHALAAMQMTRFGSLLGFDLASRERAEAFLGACRLVIEATSFGGVHSSAERRARWGGDAVTEGFVRFSAGCEDSEDLLADVAQALDATAP